MCISRASDISACLVDKDISYSGNLPSYIIVSFPNTCP